MLIAFIDLVPAPEVLMVEAIFRALVMLLPVVLVDSSTTLIEEREPVSAVVWTYFVEALPTVNIVPVVWAAPPVKVSPVWVVKASQSKVWTVAFMSIAPLPEGSPIVSQLVPLPLHVPQVGAEPVVETRHWPVVPLVTAEMLSAVVVKSNVLVPPIVVRPVPP